MFSKVDFPEPELPITNTNSPFFTENETLFSAITLVSASP